MKSPMKKTACKEPDVDDKMMKEEKPEKPMPFWMKSKMGMKKKDA